MRKFALASCLILLCQVGNASARAQNSELDGPFFQDLRSGAAFAQVSAQLPDPHLLSMKFDTEQRANEWAADAEAEIGRAMSRLGRSDAISDRIQCRTTICEIRIVSARPDFEIGQAASRYLGAVAALLEKKMTMGVGPMQSGKTAMLIYLHDEGDGL
jgi:hypothetical protein